MSKLGIGTGITPDDGNGDSLLGGAVKINSNFDEIYSYFGDGSNLSGSWQKVSSGITTTLNVGIATTNPRFPLEVGAVGSSGTSLYVNGDARITGILTVGSSSITLDGLANIINVGSGVTIDGSSGSISVNSIEIGGETSAGFGVTSITAGSGISVDQSTGNVTITAVGGGESYWESTLVGIHTLSNVGIGTTNPTSALTVKGNTSLETLNVSGISSFNNTSIFTSNVNIRDSIKLNLGNDNDFEIYHDTTGGFNNSYINATGNSLSIQANLLTLRTVGGGFHVVGSSTSTSIYHPVDNTIKLQTLGAGITVTGTTFTNDLSVSGVSTFSGNTRFDGYLGLYGTDNINFFDGSNNVIGSIDKNGDITYWTREDYQKHIFQNSFGPPQTLFEIGPVNYSYKDFTVSGITSTRDLIVYGTGNETGSISSVALMSRTNYLDFGPAIPNTSAPQSFAIRLGSDKATGTFGPYNILQASWTNPSGSVSLNNWNGTEGISINDNGVFALSKPVIVGTATSTETADQKLQVTGGAYVSDSVGIGTTVASSKLTVRGGDISVGVSTAHGVVLTSPNGTQFRLIVDDSGNLITVSI